VVEDDDEEDGHDDGDPGNRHDQAASRPPDVGVAEAGIKLRIAARPVNTTLGRLGPGLLSLFLAVERVSRSQRRSSVRVASCTIPSNEVGRPETACSRSCFGA